VPLLLRLLLPFVQWIVHLVHRCDFLRKPRRFRHRVWPAQPWAVRAVVQAQAQVAVQLATQSDVAQVAAPLRAIASTSHGQRIQAVAVLMMRSRPARPATMAQAGERAVRRRVARQVAEQMARQLARQVADRMAIR
jgi:hypothetical protein